jgi:hypothetical protein
VHIIALNAIRPIPNPSRVNVCTASKLRSGELGSDFLTPFYGVKTL